MNPSFSLLTTDPLTWGIPEAGSVFLGINAAGQLVLKKNDGTFLIFTGAPSP
jgi:hypothetical protein